MKHLFLFSQSPYQSNLAREALAVALAFAAFDETVQIVFIGDGVYQLLAQQNSDNLQQKSLAKSLAALPIYDVEDVFICQQSLSERHLQADALCLAAKIVAPDFIQALIQQADTVQSF